MSPSSYSLIILSLSVSLGACEDFVRFKTEKYSCDTNHLGLISVELQTQRGSTAAKLYTDQGMQTLKINLRDRGQLDLQAADNAISINRETGELKALFGGRYAVMVCEKTVFAM
tara:strand:+ start:350 stop:691 length:342 start_codon:yes stop_codon:yes gene_type:complete